MSAKKLGRFVGLVLVLAAFLGGVAQQESARPTTAAVHALPMVVEWA
jgi:hypothetical protein